MKQTKHTTAYEAPKMEFIEMAPREVLCGSTDMDASVTTFQTQGTQGGWIAP